MTCVFLHHKCNLVFVTYFVRKYIASHFAWFIPCSAYRSSPDLLTSPSSSASFQIKAVDAATLHLKEGGRLGDTLTRTRLKVPSPAWNASCPSAPSTSCRPWRTRPPSCGADSAATRRSPCPTATLCSKCTTWGRRRSFLWTGSKQRRPFLTCWRVSRTGRSSGRTTPLSYGPDTSRSKSWARVGSSQRPTCRTSRTAPQTPTGPTSSCTSASTGGSSCSVGCSGAAVQSERGTWPPVWDSPSSGRWATGSRPAWPRCRRERWKENSQRTRPILKSKQRAPRCQPVWEKVRIQHCHIKVEPGRL